MEQIESPTTPNQIENPQLGFQTPPSSPPPPPLPPPFPVPLPDPDPSFSDPDQTAQDDDHDNHLHEELQNQLNLTDSKQEYDNWDDYPQVEEEKEEVKSEESDKRSELFYENEREKVGGDDDDVDEEEKKNERTSNGYNGNNTSSNRRYHQYPVRPEAEDCAFYMKTGTCKFGSNCKFNHPVRRKNQAVKENVKEREEATEKPVQTECKYYLRTGGCKYGKACRYNHSRAKASMPPVNTLASPILELNFLGLPIRLGEKECEYYMRHGTCKYGANCKYNHPDPTTVGGSDPSPSTFVNGGSAPLQAPSQSGIGSWSSPRALNEPAPFVPMVFSPTQGVPPQSPEWNGYQAPLYPSDRILHPPPSYVMSNPPSETNAYTPQQQQIVVDEFPERPGQPQCSFFMKFGDCKFKSNCKYHHPKNRISKSPPPLTLSDKGLPLRPDQNICSHYSRYGICKFGPACKFDHSIQPSSSTVSGDDQPTAFGNSATQEEARPDGSGHGSDTAIEQPV